MIYSHGTGISHPAEFQQLKAQIERMKCCGNCINSGYKDPNEYDLYCMFDDLRIFNVKGKCISWEQRK